MRFVLTKVTKLGTDERIATIESRDLGNRMIDIFQLPETCFLDIPLADIEVPCEINIVGYINPSEHEVDFDLWGEE